MWRWWKATWREKQTATIGLLLLCGWNAFGIVNHVLVLLKLFAYPQEFWFVALTNYQLLYTLEITSIPLLLLGLLLLRKRAIGSADALAKPV